MKTIKPLCPTASVVGFASVTLPVKVNTKFWFVAKSKVTLPVFDVSVKVLPAKLTLASFAVIFASVIFAVVTALSASFAVVTPPSATSAATTAPGAIFAEVIALS